MEFYKIWVEQCEAALGIKEQFGTQKALGYLIGEKFMNFLKAADSFPSFTDEIPSFVEEIKSIFRPYEIAEYFRTVNRVGALGHIMSNEKYEEFRHADGADNIVEGAETILRLEQAKNLLVD